MLKQATKRKRNDMQYETKGGIKNKKNEKWEIKKENKKIEHCGSTVDLWEEHRWSIVKVRTF
jgi:hypothetical protein